MTRSRWIVAATATGTVFAIGVALVFGVNVFRHSGARGALVAAVQSPTTAPTGPPSPPASASPTVASPSPSPSITPSPVPLSGAGATGILIDGFSTPSGPDYTIALVDTSGTVTATATAAKRTHGSGVFLPLPNVSASSSRVYYLDGDSTVKFLGWDGSTGTVMTLAVDSNSAAVFAISPDDKRIAVAVISYQPTSTHLYVEDVATGANRIDLPSPTTETEWPVGWHQGHLVLGRGTLSAPAGGNDGFAYGPTGYRLVDAANGAELGVVCPIRAVEGAPTPAGTVCADTPPNYLVADWTGATRSIASAAGCPHGVLSPDGGLVADGCFQGLMRLVDRSGTAIDGGGLTATPLGWIDGSHYIARAPSGPLSVFSVGPGPNKINVAWVAAVNAKGFFAGTVPGGI